MQLTKSFHKLSRNDWIQFYINVIQWHRLYPASKTWAPVSTQAKQHQHKTKKMESSLSDRNNGHEGLIVHSNNHFRSGRPQMALEELWTYKLRCCCDACKMRGHWALDIDDDEISRNGLPSLTPHHQTAKPVHASNAVQNSQNQICNSDLRSQRDTRKSGKDNEMSFTAIFSTMALMSCSTWSKPHEPLIEDDAPFCALGITALRLLAWYSNILPSKVKPIPANMH